MFGLAEILFAPVWSTLVNELAPDRLRGRHSAHSACVWGVTGIIGPPMVIALIATGVPALKP